MILLDVLYTVSLIKGFTPDWHHYESNLHAAVFKLHSAVICYGLIWILLVFQLCWAFLHRVVYI